MQFNLMDVFLLPKWTPLSKIVPLFSDGLFLGRSLYEVSDGQYLYVSSFNIGNLEDTAKPPYVTGIFFAPSSGAARRAAYLEIEMDDNAISTIPDEILPGLCAPKYGEIVKELKKIDPDSCIETAVYRIATDGVFVHRKIESKGFVFFFRGRRRDDNEAPYAAIKKLNT